ncbi:hypothetical protein [Aquiflexum lacus]|uniref:hypothetical protein n=1 Tax=Aquiflexum lacus TaxID=2483805 RepID=UPI0018946885|nr:hypothetical protein [Aquiflexum lacus]
MKNLIFIILVMYVSNAFGQIPTEVLIGNKQTHYINYWEKEIDSNGRFNFFTLSRFAIDYQDEAYNNFSIEGQLTYQITNWLGISAGGGFEGESFVPSIGLNLSYANTKGDLFIETYPTILLDSIKSFNMLGLVGYTPQLNDTWGIFSQLIFSTNLLTDRTAFSPQRDILGLFTAHQQSIQLLRIGLDFKQKFQFGIGADFNQFFKNQGNFQNYGLFLRITP